MGFPFLFMYNILSTMFTSIGESKIPLGLLNIMNLNLLRQDEIWFVERREDHSSKLYSLNKFKERFDRSVAKDYLLGRYGAVPNFGIDPWDEEEE